MSDQKEPSEQISFQRILSRTPNILLSAASPLASPLDSCSRTTKIEVLSSPSPGPSQNRFILPKVGVGVTQLGVVEGLYTEEAEDGRDQREREAVRELTESRAPGVSVDWRVCQADQQPQAQLLNRRGST